MGFLRRSLMGLFLLAATVGILTLAVQNFYAAVQERNAREGRSRPVRERVFAVNVVTVVPGDVVPVLTSFGEIRSRRTLDVRAPSGGTLVELAAAFEEGGVVRAGDLLVRIDPRDALDALEVAQADLSEAEAAVRDAERSLVISKDDLVSARSQEKLRANALQRQRDLRARGVGTDSAVETAELAEATAGQAILSKRQAVASAQTRLDQAQTGLLRGRIALADAERALDDTEIRAGFSGTLSGVSVVQGGRVNAGEQIAQLIDPTALEVSFRVSTSAYSRLLDAAGGLTGAAVTVSLDTGDSEMQTRGVVSRESAGVAEGQTGRLLFARMDEAAGFRPGDFVAIMIDEPVLRQVALVPASAVDASGRVLVLDEEARLDSFTVQILRRQGDQVLIRAPGLSGRDIVAQRTPLLGAGIKVRRLNADAPDPPAEPPLSDEERAAMIAFVEANKNMPADARERILKQLRQPEVPQQMLARLRGRMGG
jgi:membrane fusion protein, multidrug efflux system